MQERSLTTELKEKAELKHVNEYFAAKYIWSDIYKHVNGMLGLVQGHTNFSRK